MTRRHLEWQFNTIYIILCGYFITIASSSRGGIGGDYGSDLIYRNQNNINSDPQYSTAPLPGLTPSSRLKCNRISWKKSHNVPIISKKNEEDISSWRFITISDLHTMTFFSWSSLDVNKESKYYKEQSRVLHHIHQNYGGDLVLMPGDAVSYGSLRLNDVIRKLKLGNDTITDSQGIYKAGYNSFSTTKELFREAGYDILLATIGDHELGGNEGFRVSPKFSKMHTLSQARQAFGDAFNKKIFDDFDSVSKMTNQPWFHNCSDDKNFKGGVGAVSRPLGTSYENTTFAYVHRNVLFVTVDAFEIVGEGVGEFMDREHGLGGEGAVMCTVDGDGQHLAWFESILRKGRDDPSIYHMIVQAHLPIMQPVRRIFCSGQFLDYGEESSFWNLMNKYGVDIYFAGEVHANTVTKTRHYGSNLVQLVSRGNFYNNFLTIDVSRDILVVKIYNEIGGKSKFNAQYMEAGSLTIDKTTAVTELFSSGMLQLLDLESAILVYDFDEVHPLGTRQILGFKSDNNLVATEVAIRGELCTETILNHGGFGAQYDAQVCNIALVEGIGGGLAGQFNATSRMATIASGPFSAGEVISFGLWFKAWKHDRKMVMVHHANYWGSHVAKTHEKDHFILALDHGIPVIHTRPITELRSSDPRNFADGQWHHIFVSMPRKSCFVSDLEMYIDGSIVGTTITNDRRIFQTTSGRMSIGGYGFSNSGFEDAYPGSGPFFGMLDDFFLYSRSLNHTSDLLRVAKTKEKQTKSAVMTGREISRSNSTSSMFALALVVKGIIFSMLM